MRCHFLSNSSGAILFAYRKVPKFSDTRNFAVIHLKFKEANPAEILLKTCKWNSSEDPDQTATLGAVCPDLSVRKFRIITVCHENRMPGFREKNVKSRESYSNTQPWDIFSTEVEMKDWKIQICISHSLRCTAQRECFQQKCVWNERTIGLELQTSGSEEDHFCLRERHCGQHFSYMEMFTICINCVPTPLL